MECFVGTYNPFWASAEMGSSGPWDRGGATIAGGAPPPLGHVPVSQASEEPFRPGRRHLPHMGDPLRLERGPHGPEIGP